eukprot:gene10497-biopygen7659
MHSIARTTQTYHIPEDKIGHDSQAKVKGGESRGQACFQLYQIRLCTSQKAQNFQFGSLRYCPEEQNQKRRGTTGSCQRAKVEGKNDLAEWVLSHQAKARAELISSTWECKKPLLSCCASRQKDWT